MIVVPSNDGRACWIEFCGTLEEAIEKYDRAQTLNNQYELGPMTQAAQRRPFNYLSLLQEDQLDIDKSLGILDWDGNPAT